MEHGAISDEEFSLVRKLDPNSQIRKVVLLGNGAVENGDAPLRRHFASGLSPDNKIYSKVNMSVALSTLAADIHTVKNQHILSILRQKDDPSGFNSDPFLSGMDLFHSSLQRGFIAQHFLNAISGGLTKLRSEISKFVPDLCSDSIGVITTNWDELAKREKIQNLIEIHGVISNPDSMILPMERIQDDSLLDIITACKPTNLKPESLRLAFKEPTTRNALIHAEKTAFKWMEDADQLVIYGIAMNSYDSELMQVLRTWNQLTPRGKPHTRKSGQVQLTIINPDRVAAETAARFLRVEEWIWIHPVNDSKEHVTFSD